ncbi:MAG: zinc dependent phospholipase C family protein [Candidatus Odinarchaeota archaeon]
MTRKKLLICRAFALLLLLPAIVTPAYSWGSGTHAWISDKSLDDIIDFIPELDDYRNTVKSYATLPDSWRAYKQDEGPNHYFDYPTGPGKVDKAILSWTIYLAMELSKTSPDSKLIAKISGVLSHYVADSTTPLHCTVNYDPSDAHFTHSDIDSWLETRGGFDELEMEIIPHFIEDLHNYTMVLIESNYHLAEDQLIPAMYNNNITLIDTIVKTQVSKAVQFFIDTVYTAKVRSNATDIEAAINPNGIKLVETVFPQQPIINQETALMLLLGGILILSVSFVVLKKINAKKKS